MNPIRKILATAAAVVLLGGLAACSTTDGDAKERQAWADSEITTWVHSETAKSIAALDDPFNQIESWGSPSNGVLVVHYDKDTSAGGVADYLWSRLNTLGIAPTKMIFIDATGYENIYPK